MHSFANVWKRMFAQTNAYYGFQKSWEVKCLGQFVKYEDLPDYFKFCIWGLQWLNSIPNIVTMKTILWYNKTMRLGCYEG